MKAKPLSVPLPLVGIRVVDFTHFVAGPFATQILGDLGASIIKIEKIEGGDSGRHGPPFINGQSHYFLSFNRNKQSIALNLRKPRGQEIATKLIENADVLVENFAPGAMDRLGLGYSSLSKLKPELIYCSISGFGQFGPLARKRSYDLIGQAFSGVMSINGEQESPPLKVGIPIGDTTAGLYATIGILAAVLQRRSVGNGRQLDVAMYDGLLTMLANHGGYYHATGNQAEKWGSQHYISVPNGVFPAKDGFIALAAVSDEHWRKLCQALNAPEFINDARFATADARTANRVEVEASLKEMLMHSTVLQALDRLDEAGVPCGPVHSVGEALEHPYVADRGMVLNLSHPEYGDFRTIGSPLGSKLVREQPSAPPVLGEHSEDILLALGYSRQEIVQLVQESVVAIPEMKSGAMRDR